jgi:hypothetical protein
MEFGTRSRSDTIAAMDHLILGIFLLLAGCLLQIVPIQFFSPWGSYPLAKRELLRVIMLVVGAVLSWDGLGELFQSANMRAGIFTVILATVMLSLLYVAVRNNRRR